MRSTFGRVTLRGASRLVATPNAARNTARPARANPVPRELCTSNVITNDSKRKLEDADVDPERSPITTSIPEAKEPNVEVIVQDAAVEPCIPTAADEIVTETAQVPQSTADAVEHSGSTLVGETPESLVAQLKEFMKKNANRTALWHYVKELSREDAPLINPQVMSLMLPVLGRNSWGQTALDTLELALARKYDLGVGIYNCGLHAISRGGDSEKVSELINKMWLCPKSSVPNASTYNYLISAFVYRGKMDEAFDVLNEMKKHMIYPTFSTYHSLITGCLRRRDPRRAYQTLLAVEKQRFDVSAMTIAQVLVVSANNDDYNSTLELLDKFENALPSYSREVHRIAEDRALYRLDSQQWTSKEDRVAVRGEPILEIGAISNVLHCAFRGGRVDIALRAWNLLLEHYPDFEIPTPFWYCLVGAYAGAGEFSKAMEIIGHMRESGIKLSLDDLEMTFVRPLSFDVAVIDEQFYKLCDRFSGESSVSAGEAEVSADSPIESTVKDTTTVTVDDDIAKVLSDETPDSSSAVEDHSDDTDDVTDATETLAEVLAKAPKVGVRSDPTENMKPTTVGIEELNCIIAACSAAQDLDRAFQTYDEVESRFKLEKNVDTYNALLDGCVQIRHLRGGLRILEEMESVGVPLSPKTVHLACRLLLRNGRGKDVSAMLRKVRGEDIQVMLQTYQMFIRYLLRGDLVDEALGFIELGESQGLVYHGLTARLDYESIRKLPLRQGDNRAAEERKGWSSKRGAGSSSEVERESDSWSRSDDEEAKEFENEAPRSETNVNEQTN